jgi:hypothetical protein
MEISYSISIELCQQKLSSLSLFSHFFMNIQKLGEDQGSRVHRQPRMAAATWRHASQRAGDSGIPVVDMALYLSSGQ